MLSRSLRYSLIFLILIIAALEGIFAASFFIQKPAPLPPPPHLEIPVVEEPLPPTEPAVPITTTTIEIATTTPQFVVFAFDGSYSLKKWQETLDFAADMAASSTPVHYTYFVSGVYFLSPKYRDEYQPPQQSAGTSGIGFAAGVNDIKQRVAMVNRAIAEGHEIGSHLNGHFDGTSFTAADWTQEFTMFNKLLFSIPENNHITGDLAPYRIDLTPNDIIGLRAPELGHNDAMFQVLNEHRFSYDTSLTAKMDMWPTKRADGLWEFPLARIPYGGVGATSTILSMDYNFYYKQTHAQEAAKQGTPLWDDLYQTTYKSFRYYFDSNYTGNRAPVYIASHFSNWNDGVYWAAMRDLARDVCGMPDVRCVSYRELMQYMDDTYNIRAVRDGL